MGVTKEQVVASGKAGSEMQPTREGAKRVNVTFAPSTYQALTSLASDRGKSVSEMLREAIALSKWVHDTRAAGGHVLVEQDGKTREIVPL